MYFICSASHARVAGLFESSSQRYGSVIVGAVDRLRDRLHLRRRRRRQHDAVAAMYLGGFVGSDLEMLARHSSRRAKQSLVIIEVCLGYSRW